MRTTLTLATLTTLLTLLPAGFSQESKPAESQPAKSDLRVLFVGHDPNHPWINYEPTKRMVELHKERTSSFQALLESHFTHVTVVYADKYETPMSDAADVTIFDARPKPIEDEKAARAEQRSPARLPADFSKPALMIAEVSADVGGPIGLKLDWL